MTPCIATSPESRKPIITTSPRATALALNSIVPYVQCMTDPSDRNQEARLLRIGMRVHGTYFGVPFLGEVTHEIGGSNQFVVTPDSPITVRGDHRHALPIFETAAQRGDVTIISGQD
jgi:hypothetical protein